MRLYPRTNNTLDYTVDTGSISHTIANNTSATSLFTSLTDFPNNTSWGTFTNSFVVGFSVGYTNVFAKARVNIVTSTGTVRQSGAYTAEQQVTAGDTKTFTPSISLLVSPAATDRYQLEVVIRNASGVSRTIGIAMSSSYVDTTLVQYKTLDIWSIAEYEAFDNVVLDVQAVAIGGRIKVYLAGVWVEKPIKYYNGSAWVEKPLRYHNGTTWVLT